MAEQRASPVPGLVRVLYAGRDALIWNLLDHIPFVAAESIDCGSDGACPVRDVDDRLRADAVLVDEHPGDANPLDVLRSIKAQARELPTIVLTSAHANDVESAAFDLGADDVIVRTGVFRRRLIAALDRVHRQQEASRQDAAVRARETQARRVLEALPFGVIVIDAEGAVVTTNGCARSLVGLARSAEAAGRPFRTLVADDHREAVDVMIERVFQGAEPRLDVHGPHRDGPGRRFTIRAMVLNAPPDAGRRAVLVLQPSRDRPSDEAELARLRAALEDREAEREAVTQTLATERAAWEARCDDLERQAGTLGEAERARQEIHRQLTDTQAELERARKDLGALEARLEAVRADAEGARAAERQLREQHAGALADADRRIQEARETFIAERAHLQATLDVVRGELERLRGEQRRTEDDLRRALDRRASGEEQWQARRQRLEEHLLAAVQALASEATARTSLTEAVEAMRQVMDKDRD